MTEIKINVICTDDKEILITTIDEDERDEIALQNGDSETFYVYDDKSIIIEEQLKD